ncbi:MAG: mandelate racemase/muconate lactonizing enzyme family protein [Subtercola sp.]|nr:mandelate racemase/muconate lactonizing enzyme family protein [Subtercola sp.]
MLVKITSIETFHRNDYLAIVRIRTDDGAEGYGQTSPYLANQTVPLIHSDIASFFIGTNPWDLEANIAEFARRQYKFHGTTFWRALCGIDTAVWDLLGRAVGQPVYRMLGGAVRTRIPVYGSSMSRTISPEAEAERLVGLVETNGFRGFKIRIAEVMGRDVDVYPGRTEHIIRATRQALGDDVTLHADANGGYSVSKAIRVGRMLEEYGFGHFEEPCPFAEIENTAQVAAALDIPVAGGEQDNSIEQFNRIIGMRGVDIIQPDIGYIGGMSRARKVTTMAEAAGIPATPHCANDSLLQVFTLHLAASQPAVSQLQEWSIEDKPWFHGIFSPMPQVIDGHVTLTDAPGWGVEIDDHFLATAQYDITT